MDEAVIRSLAKWPDVPDVFGWLRLDQRGQWRLKDEIVRHAGLISFLGRNYASDTQGRWLVQNGPQRVFVALDYTPWVVRLDAASQPETHTGLPLRELKAAYLDEQGNLLIESEHGIGVVSDRDLPRLLDAICEPHGASSREHIERQVLALMRGGEEVQLSLVWNELALRLTPLNSQDLPAQFGFVAKPAT